MKKLFLVLLFVLGLSAYCQEYHFDKALTYNDKGSENEYYFLKVIMINSTNSDYYAMMMRSEKSKKNIFKTVIYDLKTNTLHYFSVSEVTDKLEYKYIYSAKINQKKCTSSLSLFELKISENESEINNIRINKFNNTSEKKIVEFCDIEVKPMENCNLTLFLNRFYKNYSCCELLNFPENYIPESAIIKYEDNTMNMVKLIGTDDVSYNISLDKNKIKIKE